MKPDQPQREFPVTPPPRKTFAGARRAAAVWAGLLLLSSAGSAADEQKLTLAEARARIPDRPLPAFWVGDVKDLAGRWEKLKAGQSRVIAVSPGGRPVYLLSYGEREAPTQNANFNSALGGQDPSAYRDRQARKKPVVFLIGPVHGQEVEGLTGLVNLIQIIETGVDLRGKEQPRLRALAQQCRVLIVPAGNPDGIARFEPRMLHAMRLTDLEFWGQGTWSDDTLCRWPAVKRVHPMTGSRVGFLGCYFDDAGVNPMHEEYFAPMSTEASALLRVARDEAPDWAVSLHSHEYNPEIFRPAYVPLEVQTAVRQLVENYYQRLTDHGLAHGPLFETGLESGSPPPPFNLVGALYHISGANPFTFESPHGLLGAPAKAVTPEQILDIELLLYESIFEHALAVKNAMPAKTP
jgi:hypothetical protein